MGRSLRNGRDVGANPLGQLRAAVTDGQHHDWKCFLTRSLFRGQMLTVVVGQDLADFTLSIQLSNLLSTSISPSS